MTTRSEPGHCHAEGCDKPAVDGPVGLCSGHLADYIAEAERIVEMARRALATGHR